MNNYRKKRTGKVWVGVILLVIGVISLANTLGIFFPDWVISWPMLLIIFGLFKGARHGFRHPGAIIPILIGGAFLVERIVPEANLHNFIWPMVIITFGVYLIVGRNRSFSRVPQQDLDWDKRFDQTNAGPEGVAGEPFTGEATTDTIPPAGPSQEDFLDTVSIFGSTKKNIVSKNFRGGEIVTIMGGAELNLTQADFTGPVVLEVVQVFGGTKIVVPSNWKIASEMVAIFGGIEDKRIINVESPGADKVLVIKGTSIFGGVTIRSY